MDRQRPPEDLVYLGFQKAFDEVPHQRMLVKVIYHELYDKMERKLVRQQEAADIS